TVQNEPAIAPSSDIEGKFSQIQELIQKNDLLKARDAASAILHSPNVVEYDPVWRKAAQAISDINRIFSTTNTPCPEKQTYVIKDKDVLVRIAHNQKTTVQAIMNMNRIPDPRKIWIGQKLSYIDGDWSIKVSKSQFLLTLYRNGELYRVFKVGIGKDNRTPVGTFQIRDKVINPAWDSPEGRIPPSDPRNILGTRWMGLDATGDTSSYLTGYGIHGTTMPETVGTPSSAGCVRLKNEDVEDLFNYIPEPASAKVNVTIIE
ncbi:MAG: L,D-transpeptidase family protein, partial [Victivallales bacterium]|nr:L,D-transpeptidase family protein [Victivallales bacterium]